MTTTSLIKIFFCIVLAGVLLYCYIEKQNQLTALRMEIPPLEKEVQELEEEIARVEYEIDRFENPINLMELARQPEYRHLQHPYFQDIVILPREDHE